MLEFMFPFMNHNSPVPQYSCTDAKATSTILDGRLSFWRQDCRHTNTSELLADLCILLIVHTYRPRLLKLNDPGSLKQTSGLARSGGGEQKAVGDWLIGLKSCGVNRAGAAKTMLPNGTFLQQWTCKAIILLCPTNFVLFWFPTDFSHLESSLMKL